MMNFRGQMPHSQPGPMPVGRVGIEAPSVPGEGVGAPGLGPMPPIQRTSLASPVQPQRPFGQIGMPPVRSPLSAFTL